MLVSPMHSHLHSQESVAFGVAPKLQRVPSSQQDMLSASHLLPTKVHELGPLAGTRSGKHCVPEISETADEDLAEPEERAAGLMAAARRSRRRPRASPARRRSELQ